MRTRRSLLTLCVAVIAICSAPAIAQKEKRPEIGDFPLWTVKKGEQAVHTRQFVPGLNAALLLTTEQIEKIHAARQETLGSDDVQSAGRTIKTDPHATEAQKEAARKVIQEAHAKLYERVNAILTAEQKALIQKINASAEEVNKAVAEEFKAQYATAKGNEEAVARLQKEMRAKFASDFVKRLDGVLTAEQKAAMAKAAEEEKKREGETTTKKKDGK